MNFIERYKRGKKPQGGISWLETNWRNEEREYFCFLKTIEQYNQYQPLLKW